MSEKHVDLDVMKLIKEISKQSLQNFELEYGDLKIKFSASAPLATAHTYTEETLPDSTPAQIEAMEEMEQKTIVERLADRDESLLEELDYSDPTLAGDLIRANEIKVGASGAYEFVEKETIHA